MHFAIVSYTFPPSKEIGGRRWAKFSQHLSRLGHEVTVVCANKSTDINWYREEYPGINFRLLPKRYPDWLSGYTKSFGEKLGYFFATRILKFFTRHNLFDKGFAWRNVMLNALEDLHQHNKIDILIASGAPFSILHFGAEFKNKHKEIFYVTDLRDPWTWGDYYGLPNLPLYKKKYQKHLESESMKWSDMVCYSTQSIGDFLKNQYPAFESKMLLLPHAYEPDKFPKNTKEEKRNGFIYGGSLYPGLEDYFKKIAAVIDSNPDPAFKWDIYTGSPYPLLDDPLFTGKNIVKHSFVPEQQLFQEIKKSSAYLVLFPPTDKDLISTKFFEIIYTGTPILYIGAEGDVGKFIRENRVGVHILPENIEEELPKYLKGKIPFEPGYFDISQYTFEVVTQNFVKAIIDFKIRDWQGL